MNTNENKNDAMNQNESNFPENKDDISSVGNLKKTSISAEEFCSKLEAERSLPVTNGLGLSSRWRVAAATAYPSNTLTAAQTEAPTPDYVIPPDAPEKEDPCSCCGDGAAGGSSTGNGSVDFSLTFGRFPEIPGLEPGKLGLYSNLLHLDILENPAVLKFEHITRRRCTAICAETESGEAKDVCLVTERGYPRFTKFDSGTPDGFRNSRAISKPENMRKITLNKGEIKSLGDMQGAFFEETLGDSAVLLYSQSTGELAALKTKSGVWVTASKLEEELKVTEYNLFSGNASPPPGVLPNDPSLTVGRRGKYIRQIWSRTDGLLDMEYNRLDPGVHGYTLRWYAPGTFGEYDPRTKLHAIPQGAKPLKSWRFSPEEWLLALGPDSQDWPAEYPELQPGLWPMYDYNALSFSGQDWTQLRKFWPYDAKFLKSFTITENRDGEESASVWSMPNSTAELIYSKGGFTSRKTRYAHECPTSEEIKNSYVGPDSEFLEANNLYAKSVEETTWINGLETERTIYARFAFGDVCTFRSRGSGSSVEGVSYEYEMDQKLHSYGCLKAEYHSSGNWILREYDTEKREISRTQPWAGGGEKITCTAYMKEYFNDRRVSSLVEYIRVNGQEHEINRTEYEYIEDPGYREEKVTRTALGFLNPEDVNSPHREVSLTRWYGRDYSENSAQYARAAGRLLMTQAPDGTEEWYEYDDCDVYDQNIHLIHRSTKTTRLNRELIPGQSEKVEYYYNAFDELQMEVRYVLLDEGFVEVGRTRRRFDISHRVVFEETSGGTSVQTDWTCQGPSLRVLDNGQTVAYEYDTSGKLTRKTESALHLNDLSDLTFTNMGNRNLPAIVTEYTYDVMGRTIAEKTTMGQTVSETQREYDLLGRPVKETDAAGISTSYIYSGDGLTTTVVSPSGATFISRRHQDGSLLSEEGTGRQDRFFSYEYMRDGLLTRVRLDGPAGPAVEESIVDGLGHVRAVVRPGGDGQILATAIWYDRAGRPVCEQTGGQAPVCWEYGAMNSSVRITRSYSSLDYTRVDRTEEMISRYVSKTLSPFPDHALVWREETQAVYWGEFYLSPILEKTYDLVTETSSLYSARVRINQYGQTEASWSKRENEKLVEYDTIPGASLVNMTVSMNGWTVFIRDRLSGDHKFWYEFERDGFLETQSEDRKYTFIKRDLAGRPVSLTKDILRTRTRSYDPVTGLLFSETDFTGAVTHYAYDLRGREVARFGEGTQPLAFTYDDADNLTSMTTWRAGKDPITANPVGLPGGDTTQWTYDQLTGLVLTKTMADGKISRTRYDLYGRPVEMISPRGLKKNLSWDDVYGQLRRIDYNDGTPSIIYAYNNRALPESVTDGEGTRTWTYNLLNLPIQEHFQGDCIYDLYTNWDLYGRRLREDLDVNGKTCQSARFEYDCSTGRPDWVGDDRDWRFEWKYEAGTGLTSAIEYLKYGSYGLGKILTVAKEYDSCTDTLVKTRAILSSSNQEIVSLKTSIYQNGGQLTWREDTFLGRSLPEKNYTYNSRGELASEISAGAILHSYSYDNAGNRVEETGSPEASLKRYSYNMLNQYGACEYLDEAGVLQKNITPGWDSDGNQIKPFTLTGEWNIVWNAENRPVSFSKGEKRIECQYDYMGRRTSRTVYLNGKESSGRKYVYSGYRLIAELDASLIQENRGQEPLRKTWLWDGNETPGNSLPMEIVIWDTPTPYPQDTSYPDTVYPDTDYPANSSDGYETIVEPGYYITPDIGIVTAFFRGDGFTFRNLADPTAWYVDLHGGQYSLSLVLGYV